MSILAASGLSKTEPIPVAVVLTEGATMIDFAGPWEVFQDATVDDRAAFQLYTVSDAKAPIRTSGGMQVVPDYTFDDAPPPAIVVVGAQRGSPRMQQWLQQVAPRVKVLMSVCTGAFKLAAAGLLDGKKATTHHDFFDEFEKRFPRVSLQRGSRFVQSSATVFTAGGLTSGIDLALHVVEVYFGRAVAERTAKYMEYEGQGWLRTSG